MASFTAVGDKTTALSFNDGETISWSLAGTFTGSVVLESTRDPVVGAYQVVDTLSSVTSASHLHEGKTKWYRLRCTVVGAAETITATIAEAAGQVAQSFEDTTGTARLQIVEGGAKVLGALEVTGAVTAAAITSDQADLAGVAITPTEYTASGAIPVAGASFVQLNKEVSSGLTMTYAAPSAGTLLTITQTDSGTTGHTVTLTSGTFDGTNEIATFNAAGETLVLQGVSDTRFGILLNIGSVALTTAG
jgi:hypothetical protein